MPEGEGGKPEASFGALLLYVLGILGAVALLALVAVWLIRSF